MNLLVIQIYSQTATSIANGNWTSPLTWNCTCVPTPGYTVIINHNVTLTTSFAYTTGSITINSGGSLIQDATPRDIWVNGGSFSNAGTVDLHYLWTQTGTMANSGTISLRSFLNYVNFTNSGTIQNLDSLYTTGNITNNGSFLNIDSITNSGIWINNGICTFNQFTSTTQFTNNNLLTYTDITNFGTMTNTDTITCLNSTWNRGTWNNQSGAYVSITNDILNNNPGLFNAVFNNNGKVVVTDSWYNLDTVKGTTGSWTVGDTSSNTGKMLGTFDFCDLSHSPTPPIIDFNTGFIAPGITWCQSVGIIEPELDQFNIYPNPSNSKIIISTGETGTFHVKLYSLDGKLLSEFKNQNEVDVSGLKAGSYLVNVLTQSRNIMKVIFVVK